MAIKNLSGKGTWSLTNKTSLLSYVGTGTSPGNNAYQFPSDGLVIITSLASASVTDAQCSLYDSNGGNRTYINMTVPSGHLNTNVIPVCKDMKFMFTHAPSNCTAYFHPYAN